MLSEEWLQQNFDRTGNDPRSWMRTADDLMAAVRILKERSDSFEPTEMLTGDPLPDAGRVMRIVLLLQGFRIECILKALYLKRGIGVLAIDGKYVEPSEAGSHNLVQISEVIKVNFSDEQRDVLKRLSIYMVSLGRYPIPKSWNLTKIQKLHGGGKGPPTYWGNPSDDVILDKIEELLIKEMEGLP